MAPPRTHTDAQHPFRVIRENFFAQRPDGQPIQLDRDVFFPFFHRVADAVRAVRSDWLVFAEREPLVATHGHPLPELAYPAGYVNASHWCMPPCAGGEGGPTLALRRT